MMPNSVFEFNQFDSCRIQSRDEGLELLELCKRDQVLNKRLGGQSNKSVKPESKVKRLLN